MAEAGAAGGEVQVWMQKVLMCLLGLLVVFVIAVAGTLIGASVFAEGDTRTNALQLLEGGGGYVWQAILLAIGYAVGKGRQKADANSAAVIGALAGNLARRNQ